MKKFLKTFTLFLSIVLVGSVIAIGALMFFVSPNTLKPLITAQVLKHTGRQLTIDGNLSWSLWPYLNVKVGHMTLQNASNQKAFIEIKQATLGVKLKPLLHRKIETNNIELDGLKVTLLTDTNGQQNWKLAQAIDTAPDQQQDIIQAKNNQPITVAINIPSLDIKNSSIIVTNQQTHQITTISDLEFHAKNISLANAFPIKSAFTVTTDNKQTFKVSLQSEVIADLNQHNLRLNKFSAAIANLKLAGNLNVNDYASPDLTIKGHLETNSFDAKKLLQALGQDSASLQIAKMAKANIDMNFENTKVSATDNNPFAALRGLSLKGNITLDELQSGKFKVSNINGALKGDDGIIALSPLTADLYQGKLLSEASINLINVTPKISLQGKIENAQAEPLLADLYPDNTKFKIKGAANINLNLTTQGNTGDALLQQLNGTGAFNVANGQLTGINVGYYIDAAYALLKQLPKPPAEDDVTNFGNLSATLQFNNGVMTNNDLYLDSPRFDTKGQGSINLVTKKIKYQLQVNLKDVAANHQDKDLLNLYNVALPINIAGSLNSPSISLDASGVLALVAKVQIQHLEDRVQDKVAERVSKKLKGKVNIEDAGKLLNNFLGG